MDHCHSSWLGESVKQGPPALLLYTCQTSPKVHAQKDDPGRACLNNSKGIQSDVRLERLNNAPRPRPSTPKPQGSGGWLCQATDEHDLRTLNYAALDPDGGLSRPLLRPNLKPDTRVVLAMLQGCSTSDASWIIASNTSP